MKLSCLPAILLAATVAVHAAPVTYDVDPDHTHPSFETDHFGGLSVWRGIFARSRGTIVMDKTAGTGEVDIHVDAGSVLTGQEQVDATIRGPEILDTAKYPEFHYVGRLGGFRNGAPSVVTGELTMHGVTRPLTLTLDSFKCMPHPLLKREVCGADAVGTLNRDDFGITSGKDYGFKMAMILRIQVEAIAEK